MSCTTYVLLLGVETSDSVDPANFDVGVADVVCLFRRGAIAEAGWPLLMSDKGVFEPQAAGRLDTLLKPEEGDDTLVYTCTDKYYTIRIYERTHGENSQSYVPKS